MLFSSLSFLLYFFPLVILIHYFLPQRLQNPFLFLASLIFYAWGDARYLPLFFILLAADWLSGMLLSRCEKKPLRLCLLWLGLGVNLGALLYYKYSAFLDDAFSLRSSLVYRGALPLGISFFTFQAMGYIVDVYLKKIQPEKDPVSFGAFIFMFPQLIAGPIIRYSEMREALHRRRRPDQAALERGMLYFVAGLASKVLFANSLGLLAEQVRAVSNDSLCAFLFVFSFGLHVYFDFMGYSVMAVGMGRMLGFSFPKNFNHPYAASSVTDFWRRWHITLSAWLRDYVYFPLGGSRKGTARTIVNLLIVWLLTGIWHGAGWNFLLWGLLFFFAIVVDKFLLCRLSHNRIIRRLWMFLSVLTAWNFFYFATPGKALSMLKTLFSFQASGAALFWMREYAVLLIAAILLCAPRVVEWGKSILRRSAPIRFCTALTLLLLCIASLAESSYNPFLYFHF